MALDTRPAPARADDEQGLRVRRRQVAVRNQSELKAGVAPPGTCSAVSEARKPADPSLGLKVPRGAASINGHESDEPLERDDDLERRQDECPPEHPPGEPGVADRVDGGRCTPQPSDWKAKLRPSHSAATSRSIPSAI